MSTQAQEPAPGAPPLSRPTSRGLVSIRVVERRLHIWELRKRGLSYAAIAKELGISSTQVGNDLQACFKRFNKLTEEETVGARRLELERLDALQAAWWDRAIGTKYHPAEERAVRVIDMVMTQRSRLLGLYAPAQARIDVSVTLDQIIGDTPGSLAAIDANRSAREEFLATRGKPVPAIEGGDGILDGDFEEIEEEYDEPVEAPEEDFVIGGD